MTQWAAVSRKRFCFLHDNFKKLSVSKKKKKEINYSAPFNPNAQSPVAMTLWRSNGFKREMDKWMDVPVMTFPFKHSRAFWETECILPNWWNSGLANNILRNVCSENIQTFAFCDTTETFWNRRRESDRSGDLSSASFKI